jgi:hypothetical protein
VTTPPSTSRQLSSDRDAMSESKQTTQKRRNCHPPTRCYATTTERTTDWNTGSVYVFILATINTCTEVQHVVVSVIKPVAIPTATRGIIVCFPAAQSDLLETAHAGVSATDSERSGLVAADLHAALECHGFETWFQYKLTYTILIIMKGHSDITSLWGLTCNRGSRDICVT